PGIDSIITLWLPPPSAACRLSVEKVFGQEVAVLARRVVVCFALALALWPIAALAAENPDVAAAREVFQRNLAAIRARDRAAYLACYRNAEDAFVRTGDEGLAVGYADFEKQAGTRFPDTFEATDLKLVPIAPGAVYGTYRYRVRYGDDEQTGVSERLFVK